MQGKLSRIFSFPTLLALLIAGGAVYAAVSYRVNHGTTVQVDEWGTCKKITNASATKDYFIPTNTAAEWQAFRNADAGLADISLAECAVPGFVKTFGGTSSESGKDIKQTSDGGYIAVGDTSSYGAGGSDLLIVKFDQNGSVQWSKAVGGSATESGNSIQQTSDGGYIATGRTTSYGAGLADLFLVKFDSSGAVQWSKTAGGNGDEVGDSVQQTSDGGYVVTGYTTTISGNGPPDLLLVKFNSSGTIQWSKAVTGSAIDVGISVQQTSDSGYIVVGHTTTYGAGNYDLFLVKFDSTGAVSWKKTLGGSRVDSGLSVIQTSDGGYAVAGGYDGVALMNGGILIAKFSSNGSLLWSKEAGPWLNGSGTRSGGGGYGNSIQQTPDGGYVVGGNLSVVYCPTGYTACPLVGNGEAVAIKVDGNGVMQWATFTGRASGDYGTAIVATSDGGYALTGYANFDANGTQLLLEKLESNGGISDCWGGGGDVSVRENNIDGMEYVPLSLIPATPSVTTADFTLTSVAASPVTTTFSNAPESWMKACY